MKVEFEELFKELKGKAVDLAKLTVSSLLDEAKAEANTFLDDSKEKLREWTLLLADRKITADEFAWLVNSQLAIGQMKLLTQAGLAQIRADQFKGALLNMVVDVVLSRLLPVKI